MTTPPVPSITDEQLAELESIINSADEEYPQRAIYASLITRLRAAEADRDQFRADLVSEIKKRWDGNEQSRRENREEIDQLRAEVEALRDVLSVTRKAFSEAIHWEDMHPIMKRIDTAMDRNP